MVVLVVAGTVLGSGFVGQAATVGGCIGLGGWLGGGSAVEPKPKTETVVAKITPQIKRIVLIVFS